MWKSFWASYLWNIEMCWGFEQKISGNLGGKLAPVIIVIGKGRTKCSPLALVLPLKKLEMHRFLSKSSRKLWEEF